MEQSNDLVLKVQGLTTRFYMKRGLLTAVDDVNWEVRKGEVFGLVGESGCGKSVSALSILRLIPEPPGEIEAGGIIFEGQDLATKSEREMQKIRGSKISMVFQEPMTSLNPVFTIGTQICDGIIFHQKLSKKQAREKAAEILTTVGIPSPASRLDSYPHEFSGGMRQRVMLAIALSNEPSFLIADEPTTALDVTIQAQILELIQDMIMKFNTSLLFITHNMGVVAHMCDRIGVMYASHMVETADKHTLFESHLHPYTEGLLNSIPAKGKRKQSLHSIDGVVCNMLAPPSGCKFHPRCERSTSICMHEEPRLKKMGEGHFVACHLYD